MNAILPRTLHSKDLRELTRGERLLLFFFVAFPGNHTAAVVSSYIGAVTGRTAVTATAVEQLFRTLEDEKVFEKGVAARGVFGTAYRLAANFSLRALRQLGADASKLGWWPTPAVLLNGHAGDWLGAELAAAVRNYVDPKQVWQIAETLKALLVGGPCAIGGVPQGARYPLASVHWSAVSHLCRLLAPLEPLPAEDLSGAGADQLLAVLFEFGFLSGHDVRFALLAARKVFAQDKLRVSVSSLCAYCALAVWTGRRDFLTNAVSLLSRGSPAERFAALCRDVFSGDFPEAEKAFASGADSFRGVFSTDVSTPVWALGLALALREGAPMVRVSKYAKELKREVADLLNWHPAGRSALHDVDRLRTALVRRLMGACSPMWQPSAVDESADVLAKAKALFLAGYSTLAALHVAEVRRMKPELNGLDAFAQMLDEGGAVPLVKRVAEEPKWKAALRALNDRLPDGRDKPVEQVLNGTIGWVLTWTPAGRGGEDCFLCARLLPVYRGPRGADDGSDDRRLTLKSLAGARYRACLTTCDMEILQTLLKRGYNPRMPYSVPDETLGLLCGHPRLLMALGLSGEDEVVAPMTLTRTLCELSTRKTDDGGMELSLPPWLMAAENAASVIRSVETGRFLYHAITKRVRDVAAIFAEHGTDGRLVVPAEGLAEAKTLLVRLVGEMSVVGDFASEAGSEVARVVGDTTPHVRLVYANDVLSLSLVVEPIANRAVAVCEPGIGLAERLVLLRGGRTVLLVRDLAAEEAAASSVRAALESFDAWATAKNRWLISDAEEALEALRTLKALGGIKLEWPEGEKMRLTTPSPRGVKIEASGVDWFEVGGDVALDDGRVVKLLDLLHALANREGNYVRFGENDYVYLSNELLRRLDALAAALNPSGAKDGVGLSAAALPMLAKAFSRPDGNLPSLPETLASRAASIQTAFAARVEVPRRFKGTLRPYQEEGFAWLSRLAACGFGACLADDMGLGKTVELIALLLARAVEGPSLVVVPASVCHNWIREVERFAPTLHVVTPGEGKNLPRLNSRDVVIASYGLVVSRAEIFEAVDWNGVVLDEAQAVKNAGTQRAQIARKLKAKFRVAATGTPVENRLAEFASIFSFLNPGLLGTAKNFEDRFVEGGMASPLLKRLVEPFVLRRLKRDVLKELPEKTEVTLRVELGPEERAAYEACRVDALGNLQAKGETENRISILSALMRLRRFCCHPSLVFPEAREAAKLEAVLELLGELREAGHRVLVFSQFVDFLDIVREAIEDRKWTFQYLDGSTPAAERTAAVDAFQGGEGDFFLISLKAGGMGLNLTAANYVVLLDPWWNPAVEDQAADRAHRIGQQLPVTVYRVVVADTVEERILDLHKNKRTVSEDLLENAMGTALSNELLLSLFADGKETETTWRR